MENIVVIISADAEWNIVCEIMKPQDIEKSPYGEYFIEVYEEGYSKRIIYFQGGWGKISAAGSVQYAIDQWNPSLLSNLKRVQIVSGDRDLVSNELEQLNQKYGAIVGDWESGAIAWIAAKNKKKLIIIRGVTDLVWKDGGQAYGDISLFKRESMMVMSKLIEILKDKLIKIKLR